MPQVHKLGYHELIGCLIMIFINQFFPRPLCFVSDRFLQMAAAVKVDSNPKILPSSARKSPSVASKSKIQTTDIQNPQVSVNPTEISSTGNYSCNFRYFQV